MTYEITLTRLATAVAETRYSVADVEAEARAEIDALEMDDPRSLLFHCFRMPTGTDYEFICTPTPTGIQVDTASFEEGEQLATGPFKGKKVMMPQADSE